MRKHLLFFTISFLLLNYASFAQDVATLQQTAKKFTLQGDYANAILILNKAYETAPDSIEVIKDLAFNYYLNKEYKKGLNVITPALEREDADDQCFQIAGNIYQGLDLIGDCEKIYKAGIEKIPENGSLHNELGELLWMQKKYEAANKQWEMGIKLDPNYPRNYYNSCRYYNTTEKSKVWTLVYGEIYINMDPLSSRTSEIKTILLDNYKRLFSSTGITEKNKEKNNFVTVFVKSMDKQNNLAINEINPETLTMIRTRFILDWFDNHANTYPLRLFELQRQLLQEGLFEAYNQWIFGAAQNLNAYQNWMNTHTNEYNEFNRFQRSRVFKITKGQYYH